VYGGIRSLYQCLHGGWIALNKSNFYMLNCTVLKFLNFKLGLFWCLLHVLTLSVYHVNSWIKKNHINTNEI
jgi:hypothetical protein